MIVFCPSCGTQTEALAGARATCPACGSPFDIPVDARPSSVPEAPTGFTAPGAQVFSDGPVAARPLSAGQRTNGKAITSLVAGLVCCVPFLSPLIAIGCGVLALREIDAAPGALKGRGLAIGGIALGSVTFVVHAFWLLGTLGSRY